MNYNFYNIDKKVTLLEEIENIRKRKLHDYTQKKLTEW